MSRCQQQLLWLAVSVLAIARIAPAQPPGLQPEGGRGCTICHLAWADAFKRPAAITLIDKPTNANVWQQETCLGCHDGSVADSRKKVWIEHSHQVGVQPPADMKIPEQLPLEDGKLACRTCHTAHSGKPGETFATTFFLRIPNETSQLCVACHPSMTKGPGLGTHPVGGMPWPVPQPLIDAGAKVGPDPFRLICQTCHMAHGSSREDLLVMGTAGGQLCLTCHTKIRPALWRPETPREHPQSPKLDQQQVEAIRTLGTKAGPENTLICLSCHKLHHGQAGRYMLADTLHNSDLCLRCHPGRANMFKTPHDLRVSAPNERNRLGQTPEESGPCGACHSFHQFARRRNPEQLDPTGLCATCHAPGQVAAKQTGLPFSHPIDVQQKDPNAKPQLVFYAQPDDPSKKTFACLTCHNPHELANPHFLRYAPSTTCTACHGAKAATLPPAHDFTTHPDLKNARGDTGQQTGKCGFCHGVHNALGPALWVATPQPPQTFDGLCTQCHKDGGLAAEVIPPPLRHPSGPDTAKRAAELKPPLPLYDVHGHPTKEGFVACGTCHDPHGSGHSEQMLRLAEAHGPAGLCGQCHGQAKTLPDSLHSEKLLAEHFGDTGFCLPCHAAHTRPGMPATGMWAAPLGPQTGSRDEKCTGCHTAGGKGPAITPTVHPAVAMSNVQMPGTPGYMPLAKVAGGAVGQITCRTCHLSHGKQLPPDVGQLDPAKLRNLRPMLRPYEAPNLCTTCHGLDGVRRFLYYHDPSKRGGPLNESKP